MEMIFKKRAVVWGAVLAMAGAGASVPALGREACRSKELKMKDCDLKMKGLSVGFSAEKIRFTSGPWTSIGDFPSHDKVSEWQEVRLKPLAGRSLIVLKVWEKKPDEITLEDLHWIVLEPQKRDLVVHVDEVIGKRTLGPNGKTIHDPFEKTSLKPEKKKDPLSKIIWSAGDRRGVLKDR
jgi:hypothetical protein